MAFNELVKSFSKLRGYLKEFFVYGFRPRGSVGRKSGRSYDDERRRIQSYLGEYFDERRGEDGKTVALRVDMRGVPHNPLYRALKSASFTDKDITLHFILFDVLSSEEGAALSEIMARVCEHLSDFKRPLEFDESTVRKKLSEYERLGLVRSEKKGNKTLYFSEKCWKVSGCAGAGEGESASDALTFASEILPMGFLGSTLLDKEAPHKDVLSFKHHYITQALDSEILNALLLATGEKRWVEIRTLNERRNTKENPRGRTVKILPLKILCSSQTGRQYVAAHELRRKQFKSYRIDNILEARPLEICSEFDNLKSRFLETEKFIWGASFGREKSLAAVEFTVKFRENEEHIFQRLVREKRCGAVERLSKTEARFSARVFDAHEMLPWIRTFICRITSLSISDKELEGQFWDDVRNTAELYRDRQIKPSQLVG